VSQYFIEDKHVSDAGDYVHIIPLAFFTFGNVYVEDTFSLAGHQALRPTHAPRVIRLIRLAIFANLKIQENLSIVTLRMPHLPFTDVE
jgi:hypothetical protein